MEVSIEDLKAGMVIQSYLGLEKRFPKLDQQGCDWLKLNFSGADVQVIRQDQEQTVGVENLTPGDLPQQVSHFPGKLKHLTHVSDKLMSALKQQGFEKFIIVLLPSHMTFQQKVEQADRLVQKAKAGSVVREQTVDAVESMMDGLAQGVSDLASLEPLVNNIIQNEYSEAMSALATLKESDHTYGHCVDVGAIFTGVYEKICALTGRKSVFRNLQETLLAALLHDVGKAVVPKAILESTVTFAKDSPEMKLIRSHPMKSGEMLRDLGLPEIAVNMGMYHHVKVDTEVYTSYPRDVDLKLVSYEARLLGIVDVYQALTGRRGFRKSWTAPAAMRYLHALGGVEFDEQVLEDFIGVLGLYPLGSFVELSDKTGGFVMNVPEDQERPLIAVVKDAQGSKLSAPVMVDLTLKTEIRITREIDPLEVFGTNALEEFIALKVG